MAKKLSEISELIDSSNHSFKEYLKESLSDNVYDLLTEISKTTDIQIFSGVIRNFFLKKNEIRDLDIVLNNEIDLTKLFPEKSIFKNSFGGYKIKTEGLEIDIWFVKNTWAYNYQKTIDFELDTNLPATAFFNFSAISYSFNTETFYYSKEFLRFLRDKEINVVYKPNANHSLCVVNSLYYSEKYSLKISKKLFEYLKYLNKRKNKNYVKIQLKHFNEILFTDDEIDTFFEKNKTEMPTLYKRH